MSVNKFQCRRFEPFRPELNRYEQPTTAKLLHALKSHQPNCLLPIVQPGYCSLAYSAFATIEDTEIKSPRIIAPYQFGRSLWNLIRIGRGFSSCQPCSGHSSLRGNCFAPGTGFPMSFAPHFGHVIVVRPSPQAILVEF